jgi:DNA-binding transcriptional regulator YiaG
MGIARKLVEAWEANKCHPDDQQWQLLQQALS